MKTNQDLIFDSVNFLMSVSHPVDMSDGKQLHNPGTPRFERIYTDVVQKL